MDLSFRMHAERTPNPNSIKWVMGSPLVEAGSSAHFDEAPSEEVSPLAARLFAVVRKEDVVPFYKEDVDSSLELRRTIAGLRGRFDVQSLACPAATREPRHYRQTSASGSRSTAVSRRS